MVSIKGGTVPMTDSYKPSVSDFRMGETEITQKQYKEILDWAKGNSAVKAKYQNIASANSGPSNFNGNSGKEAAAGETQENRPVEMVTWYDAVMYCNLLTMREMGESECAYDITSINYDTTNGFIKSATVSEVTGIKGYRLPTEAEWEYAARAGNTVVSNLSNPQYGNPATSSNLGDYAWYSANSGNKTHEVKKKSPNDYKLYDMHGNVWEWCWDWRDNFVTGTPANPRGPSKSGGIRVDRGGGCLGDADYGAVSYRGTGGAPNLRDSNRGFRVVRSL